MRKPEISTKTSDSDLVGAEGRSSWVKGRNCVYSDDSVAKYRVSIKTTNGWKSYGHFHDLETAAYVANIAILAEECEERYELNRIGIKDRQEIICWRNTGRNAGLEKLARERYERVQKAFSDMQAEDLRLKNERDERVREKSAKARAETEALAEKHKQQDEREAELIAETPTTILLDLLTRDITGEQYRKIRTELVKRKVQSKAT